MPPQLKAKELILPVFTQWEKVGSLTSILADLEFGIFYDGALLVDQMMRDDRIRGCWNVRIQSVLGMPRHFEAADATSAVAKKIADDAEQAWPKIMRNEELTELLKWGLFLGVGVGRETWGAGADAWLPKIQTWHAGALRFDLMSDTYRLRTYDKGEIDVLPIDPNWVLFTPYGHKYGRLNGLVRSISMLYLARQWAFRDRSRHSEVHGLPIRQLITPESADQRDKDQARRSVASAGSESVIVTPQGERDKWDIKLVEAMADSHKVFSAQIDHIDDAIAILLLGQRTSTKGSSGLGSDANPGQVVMGHVLRFTAECISDIAGKILGDWAQFNHGDRDLAPKLVIEVDPPEDGNEKALELSALGDAVMKLEKYGIDVRELLEEAGVPMLSVQDAQKAREAIEGREDQQSGLNQDDKNPHGNGDDNAE